MIPTADKMRQESDANYSKRTERGTAKLLRKIKREIKSAVKKGNTCASLSDCNHFTHASFFIAGDELKKLGYRVNINAYNEVTVIHIHWGDSP